MYSDRTEGIIDKLFDQLDTWRHLPSYQLERRADIFFSLYLREVLEDKLGIPIDDRLIPEFPVRIGTIYPDSHEKPNDRGKVAPDGKISNRSRPSSEQSYKVDYVASSVDKSKAILVELKTDADSHRPEQGKYLDASQAIGLPDLLTGIIQIFLATNSKRKYFRLLEQLDEMGLIKGLGPLREVMKRKPDNLHGASRAADEIERNMESKECIIVYIQPNKAPEPTNPDAIVITFDDYRSIVLKHDDLISRRFAASLCTWSKQRPG